METPHNKLVFIVEDNELYSLMLEYTLSNDSIVQCISFKTGEECIQHLELNPMLVILDYWLPGINGKETFELIKKNNPKTPVVFLTRNQDPELEKDLLKDGVYDYIYKEEDSVLQIKKIINSFIDKIVKNEKKQTRSLKIIFGILFFIAITIAIIYLYRI